ncbi:MAG: hypothetical protein WCI71_18555 [Bacteroidota bacterium]
MDEYIDSNEYINPSETESLQTESKYDDCEDKICETKILQTSSKEDEPKITVDDKAYGINKPFRIIIRAKISHDKN